MKKLVSALVIGGVAAIFAAPASAQNVDEMLKKYACLSCHAVDKKLVGPAFSAVAARYRGDDQAIARLTSSILKGSAERWGDAAMPAMPRLSEEQAKQLAGFVLQQ